MALIFSAKSVSDAPRGRRTTSPLPRGAMHAADRRGLHVVELLTPLLLALAAAGRTATGTTERTGRAATAATGHRHRDDRRSRRHRDDRRTATATGTTGVAATATAAAATGAAAGATGEPGRRAAGTRDGHRRDHRDGPPGRAHRDARAPPTDGRVGIMPGFGRGPPGRGAPGRRGRGPAHRDRRTRAPGRGGMPGRGAGRGPCRCACELNGLLPGRGAPAGRGAGRGAASAGGRGPVVGAASQRRPPGRPAAAVPRARRLRPRRGLARRQPRRSAAGVDRSAGRLGGPPSCAAFLAGAAAASAAAGCAAGNAARSLRTTGASTVEDADRTNSPISWSLATRTLLSTPSSLASS